MANKKSFWSGWRSSKARLPRGGSTWVAASGRGGTPVYTPRQYDRLAEEGYRKNVVAFRCISLIAQNAAAVPLYVKTEREGDEAAIALQTLIRQPDAKQGATAFLEEIYAYYLIAGNAYMQAIGDGMQPVALSALRPDRMRVMTDAAGHVSAYRYTANGKSVDFAADPIDGQGEILHLKAFNPLNDHYGMSPIEAAAIAIDQHNAAANWNAALLQNAGRPSGALVYHARDGALDHLTDEQRRQLRAELEQFYSGSENAGRPLILEGGLDWKEMSLSPKDMDFMAGKDMSAREIALAYHVPPQLIGIDGSLTFANFAQARLALYDDAVLPLVFRLRDALNVWLAPRFGAHVRIEADLDAVEALSPRREALWKRISDVAFLSDAEKREMLGFSAKPDGDMPA